MASLCRNSTLPLPFTPFTPSVCSRMNESQMETNTTKSQLQRSDSIAEDKYKERKMLSTIIDPVCFCCFFRYLYLPGLSHSSENSSVSHLRISPLFGRTIPFPSFSNPHPVVRSEQHEDVLLSPFPVPGSAGRNASRWSQASSIHASHFTHSPHKVMMLWASLHAGG